MKHGYNHNKYTDKLETDEQHYYFINAYCMLPFGVKRTAQAVRNEIINNKKELEDNGLEFPFKRIVSTRTILKWIDMFDWEVNRLNMYYEKSVTIDDSVNEFNLIQIEKKMKRVNDLNECLDSLQSLLIELCTTVNTDDKGAMGVLTQIGHLYKALESLHDSQVMGVNSVNLCISNWKDVKERLEPHHNPFNTTEDNLRANIDTIDYFFDTYVIN